MHAHTVATQLNRTLHKDPVAHARMTEYLLPPAGSRTTAARQRTNGNRAAPQYLKKCFYVFRGHALSYRLLCDLTALGSIPTADVSSFLRVHRRFLKAALKA